MQPLVLLSSSAPVRLAADGRPAPEMTPLTVLPGLPTYREALNLSGQHDALPPPYSGYIYATAPTHRGRVIV